MVKRPSTRKTVAGNCILNLPDDVLSILMSITPSKSVEDGVIHLARSYDAIMEDQGQEGHPVVLSDMDSEGRVDPTGLPSVDEISKVMQQTTQPRGSIGEVQ